jgi:hypothetical protein
MIAGGHHHEALLSSEAAMINVKVDTTQARSRIHRLKQTLGLVKDARCSIIPTQVIYLHCERKNSKLLRVMPKKDVDAVEARYKPKVEAAARASVKDLKAQESALARAWRYAAYLYVDKLWLAVRNGSWGRVKSTTEPEKAAEVSGARSRIQEAARAAGRRVRGTAAGAPSWIANYGVRQIERGRRWYEIQKGRQKHGERTDGDLTEREDLIVITLGAKKIGGS